MKKTTLFISKINSVFAQLSGYAIFLMMCVSVVDVIGRFILGNPLKGATDIVELLMVIGVFLGMGYVQEHDVNARVELLYNHFKGKFRTVIDIII